MKLFLALALLITLSGCYRIQIQNGARPERQDFEQGQWHHIGVIGLAELSPPVDLSKQCMSNVGIGRGATEKNEQWKTVQIQKSFLQGITQILTFGLYSPFDVNVQCS